MHYSLRAMLSFPKLLQLVLEKLEFLIFAQFSSKLFFLSNLNLKQINSKKAFCYAFRASIFASLIRLASSKGWDAVLRKVSHSIRSGPGGI